MKQLYEYAVILQEKTDKDGEVTDEARVLVEPTTLLASEISEVNIVASRQIPEDQIGNLERVTIVVRPF